MKIGLSLPNFGELASPETLREVSALAEKLGFYSLWTTDHLIIPENQPGSYGTTYETLVTLSYLTAFTSKVKIGTSILVVPQRNPVVVAKQIATIDIFSRGRVILGVGCGWLRKEFEYLGADFPRRFKILDEAIRTMKSIWSQTLVTYDSEFRHIDRALANPKPVQRPSIPIFMGGMSKLSMKRAARYGDGWHPVGLSPREVSEGAKFVKSLEGSRRVEISSRNPIKFGGKRIEYGGASTTPMFVLQGTDGEILQDVEEFEKDAGVEHLVLQPVAESGEELFATVRGIGEKIIPAVS
jgi:probable F420-dependent oxidoreductase